LYNLLSRISPVHSSKWKKINWSFFFANNDFLIFYFVLAI
jgi:hypothetical protein